MHISPESTPKPAWADRAYDPNEEFGSGDESDSNISDSSNADKAQEQKKVRPEVHHNADSGSDEKKEKSSTSARNRTWQIVAKVIMGFSIALILASFPLLLVSTGTFTAVILTGVAALTTTAVALKTLKNLEIRKYGAFAGQNLSALEDALIKGNFFEARTMRFFGAKSKNVRPKKIAHADLDQIHRKQIDDFLKE